MMRRNIVPSVHLGFHPPSRARGNAAAFAWSRPVSNGPIASTRSRVKESTRYLLSWIVATACIAAGWIVAQLLLIG